MASVQFYETEWGNRFLIEDSDKVASVRHLAQKVLDTKVYPAASIGGLRHMINSGRLSKAIVVTMGSYEDDEATFTPAHGSDLARLVLAGTVEEVESED